MNDERDSLTRDFAGPLSEFSCVSLCYLPLGMSPNSSLPWDVRMRIFSVSNISELLSPWWPVMYKGSFSYTVPTPTLLPLGKTWQGMLTLLTSGRRDTWPWSCFLSLSLHFPLTMPDAGLKEFITKRGRKVWGRFTRRRILAAHCLGLLGGPPRQL